jgi:hypothetical protein
VLFSNTIIGCHKGTCCATPLAQKEESLNSAIANQTQGQVEQGYFASLPGENQVSGVEVKTVHEATGSAAPVPSVEKWSHEAMANMRPERMQKLKVASNSGQNPGFEFLQKCWDDPAKADCDQEIAGEV